MAILRIPGDAAGRTLATAHGGLVYAVSYDPHLASTIQDQTRNALAFLDQTLSKAGASKAGILQTTVYLSDMTNKPAMDEVWCAWIGPEENWPQRACVGVDLGQNGDLIEIVVIAAQT